MVRSPEECPSLERDVSLPDGPGCAGLSRPSDQAECHFKSRQYPKAKEIYRILAETGGRPETLIRLSQAAARSQDFDTALWANKTLRVRFPKSPEAREALRKIAFLYQDARRFREAEKALQDVLPESRSPAEKRTVWERLGWVRFQLENYDQAIEAFDQAVAHGETAYSLYWKARSLERLGKSDTARPIHEDVVMIYPGTYYGLRSLERLYRNGKYPSGTLGGWWISRTPLKWRREPRLHEGNSPMEKVLAFRDMGLISEASVELRRARVALHAELPKDPKDLKERHDGVQVDFKFVENQDPDYPLPYAAFLFGESSRLDPFLVYAMMRQESRFRESVVSPVGAVGLLQIMPGTGRRLAREAAWDDFEVSWLYDPLTNIELSLRYLRDLSAEFNGKWYAMAASYNAGEKVVREWLKQRPGLPDDEFIEEIPYQETRDYVKRIYANWRAYEFIYGKR